VPIDGFLCPGHVSIILGYAAYAPIAHGYGVPCVVAGFEPAQVMAGVTAILEQVVAGKTEAVSVYPAVHAEGNAAALAILDEVFRPEPALWRAIGSIPASGMGLRDEFAAFDAANRFELPPVESYELPGCRCGEVITGRCQPSECALFAKRCTPRDPVGPCMVSSEGACAAAYKYERRQG
jgi:hydrogenase expression/formation protein HypD